MSVGVALGGGGVRGAAHIGVLREIRRAGLMPAAVAGTSSGALIGALFCAGVDWSEVEATARMLTPRQLWPRFRIGRRRLGLMQTVARWIGETTTFEDLPIPLAVVAIDLCSGREIVYRSGPVLPALHAAVALPPWLGPLWLQSGEALVDAGVLNRVPVDPLVGQVDRIVAVDVSGGGSVRGSRGSRRRRLGRAAVYRRIYELAVERVTALALARAEVVLQPAVGHISAFAMLRAGECIDAGARAFAESEEKLAALWAS
ncbi:MAG TPA: patatin-like phospholipase family protein [Limnochordia bacterium]